LTPSGSNDQTSQTEFPGSELIAQWLGSARRHVHPETAPAWMKPLLEASAAIGPSELSRNDPPATTVGPRQAAVLVLLGYDAESGPDVLLQQRAKGLRDHPREVSFPGGAWEAEDTSVVGTALREAVEETGLDPAGVDPVALLPRLLIPVSGFQVTAVLAHWRQPSDVAAVDAAETSSVIRIPLTVLADPPNRLMISNHTGWHGPAFQLPDMVIWGYTAEVLTAVLRMGNWEHPWTPGPTQDLNQAWVTALSR
jgi:8-oxo-dGTP pyrophosphatase MutT (NUDIX family)